MIEITEFPILYETCGEELTNHLPTIIISMTKVPI